jgi:hypothetical protein
MRILIRIFTFHANPDPAPHQSDANLVQSTTTGLQTHHGSILSLRESHGLPWLYFGAFKVPGNPPSKNCADADPELC